MINGQNLFNHPLKNNLRTYDNIEKVATCQGDDFKMTWLNFNKCYKVIAIDFSKQPGIDAAPRAI